MEPEDPHSDERDLMIARARGLLRSACSCYPELSPPEALARLAAEDGTPTGWVSRNRCAIEQMETFTLDPATMAQIQAIQTEPDPEKKKALKHQLDVRRLESVDWEAFTRHLRANSTRLRAEFDINTPPPSGPSGTPSP